RPWLRTSSFKGSMTLRRAPSSGSNCSCLQTKSRGSTSSRTKRSAQSSFSWNSGSVSKSHATGIPSCASENNILRIQNAIAQRRRRRWPRRVLAVVTLLLILCVLAVDGAYIYVHGKLDKIPRVAVAGLQPARAGDPQNILVVGSDSRVNQSPDAARGFGTT